MNKLNVSSLLLFAILLFLGIAVRSIPLILPYYTTDQAGVALQAWTILQGEWPIYYYGQSFQGTLEGYLGAIFFILFRPDWDLALGMLSIFSSVLFLLFFYLFVKETFGSRTAFISLILAVLAPPVLLQWGHDPRLHYSFVVVYQSFLFWMSIRFLKKPFASNSFITFFIFGAIAGLAWWTNFLNIHTLLACSILLLFKEPKSFFKRLSIPGLIGFFIGSLPFWIFNFTHRFINFKLHTFRGWEAFKSYFPGFLLYGLPNIAGLKEDYLIPGYQYCLWGGLVLFALSLIYFFFLEKTKLLKGKGLVLISFISVALITCSSVFGRAITDDGDYLLPLLPLCLIAIATFCNAVWNRSKLAGLLILAFFLLNSFIQNYYDPVQNLAYLNSAQRNWIIRYNYSNKKLFKFLNGLNIKGIYKDEDEIFKLKYLGYPNISTSDFYQDNYPPDAQVTDGAKEIAFVLRNRLKGLTASLKALNIQYQTTQLPDYLVFHSFSQKNKAWILLDSRNWSATSSHLSQNAKFAFDRLASTRWSTDTPKQKQMWYELDLGKQEQISRISIHPGNWHDYPSGLKIEVSSDKKNWEQVLSYSFMFGPFYWDGTHPFYRVRRARVDLRFEPVHTRYIRLTHLGRSKRYFWSIMELYVYGPANEKGDTDLMLESREIIKDLQTQKVQFAAADHWLSARIGSETEIEVYPSNLFTGINRETLPDPNERTPLFLNEKTALVVANEKEKECTDLLKKEKVTFNLKKYGHYIVYSGFKQKKPWPYYWTGDHLIEF